MATPLSKFVRASRTPLNVTLSEDYGGHDRYRYAREACDLVHGLLLQLQVNGDWVMYLEAKVKSRGSAKIKLKSESSSGIRLVLKPGDNNSPIRVRLVPPEGFRAQEIFGRLLLALRHNVTDDDDDGEPSNNSDTDHDTPTPVSETPMPAPSTTPLLSELGKLAELKSRVLRWREGREMLPLIDERRQPLLLQKAEVEREFAGRREEMTRQLATIEQETNQKLTAIDNELAALDREAAGYNMPSEADFAKAEQEWSAAEEILKSLRG